MSKSHVLDDIFIDKRQGCIIKAASGGTNDRQRADLGRRPSGVTITSMDLETARAQPVYKIEIKCVLCLGWVSLVIMKVKNLVFPPRFHQHTRSPSSLFVQAS